MGSIADRDNNNKSAGSVGGDTLGGVDDKLARLRQSMAPMEKQQKALDNIDIVVGRPKEQVIRKERLVPAKDEWNFFPSASDDKIIEMCKSIVQYGLLHNITVWEQPDGKYMILGGHTRVACFHHLYSTAKTDEERNRWGSIPALVYAYDQLTETDARRIIIVSNTDQRELSKSSKSKAYMELLKLEKQKAFYGASIDTYESAAQQAGTSKSMLSRYLNLLNLIPELQEAVDRDTITMMAGYHMSMLPKEIQAWLYESGEFLTLTTQAAKQLKGSSTVDEAKRKLEQINSQQKYFKYQIQTRIQKDADSDILPAFVPKGERSKFADLYMEAVRQANFPDEEKQALLAIMEKAKL